MSSTFISLTDLKRNFAEVKSGMKPKEAIEESNRCLFCYDAPCIRACPTGIDIPSFIKKIASGNLKGSARTIMEANPVGASCSRVCPTEELCEGACVLNHSSKPILIGNLQRYATDWAIKNEQILFKAGASNGKSVAVIGGGPAGLSAARELARFGFKVTVFEAKEQAGGLDTYGIVSFRLPQEISLWEVEQVRQLGVEFRMSTRVGIDVSATGLVSDYDAVVLAVGMSKVPMLGIEGEALTGVYDAIDFVESTKMEQELDTTLIGKRIAVIGAGNTAIDAATCSVRLGAEKVQIVYRRTQEEMTAYDFEYDFAKQDGVAFQWLTAPKRIIGDMNGNVVALECLRMELVDVEAGRKRPVPIEGSEFIIEVDAVIKAIGQTKHVSLIDQFELAHMRGTVTVDPSTGQTSNPKVYAAGDVIFGEGQGEAMVVSAAQQGKQTAYAIYNQLVKREHASA
ncbi:dihydropyrimidine dehydrogenase (NAD+) subunit PreT [Paenibacillus sp. V4I3]|uniref:NAD(P)-dependent oxidoreductase n=1 Tax=unclassified Paenibacillus TaxID=185978 RepID=UPI0027891969|nr:MULTISPECIES: NAD(P)-dependent oxidoreductase [unclassified Paenibacillus]MDQ0876318.1 dihydropyrimidine dehydrogenase (NAD+) subunit PreT [Paenibacillus sp. V4I3]MDQ0887650.1 dihydropyrimidine dehydrogenase (NAD+) subunit PreT [Paenibacillus sp. V4I9]